MVDLKKTSDDTELIRNELQTLTATNQQLKGDLQTVTGDLREMNSDMQKIYSTSYKLNGELDLLSYRLDKLNSDTQEIRREVYDLRRTIEQMQSELLRELGKSGHTDFRERSMLTIMFAIMFPAALITITILILALAG